ncbi:MAG TPA: hypothetical protein VGO92_13155 [Acidimicrobiales bacterium]|nr:hypothetical protein [Acidimicrobiales bacterium]
MTVDDAEDLYALPLAEFTAARNKLAKEAGDKAIAKLRKPSAAAWALNQAARSNRGDVARFLHAAEGVRSSGDREGLAVLREAEADVRRAALHALGDRAGPQLASVNALLAAAASDEEVASALRAGRLTGGEEAEADGFVGAFTAPKKAPKRDEVKAARARRQAEAAEDEAQRLEREAGDAEEAAARIRQRAEAARQKADELKADL